MITILTTVEVQRGREEDFEEMWRRMRSEQDHYAGLRTDRLLRDTDHHGRYVAISEWDEREQFNAFERASGAVWLRGAMASWYTPLSWSYLEDVEAASPAS
jgi:heme-degrading monooxygenase HmoA